MKTHRSDMQPTTWQIGDRVRVFAPSRPDHGMTGVVDHHTLFATGELWVRLERNGHVGLYLPGELRLYENMTGRQLVTFLGQLRGEKPSNAEERSMRGSLETACGGNPMWRPALRSPGASALRSHGVRTQVRRSCCASSEIDCCGDRPRAGG